MVAPVRLSFSLSLTGVALHQCIGIFGGLLAFYHLLMHWNWVDAVSERASIAALVALIPKLGLHWRWISSASKKAFHLVSLVKTMQLQSISIEKRSLDQRDFLIVMGVAGGASQVALMSATQSLASIQASGRVSQEPSSNSVVVSTSQEGYPDSAWLSSASGCKAQCGRRCAYPGHCRLYTYSNLDQYCDQGQCA